jgi:hypothetical protein
MCSRKRLSFNHTVVGPRCYSLNSLFCNSPVHVFLILFDCFYSLASIFFFVCLLRDYVSCAFMVPALLVQE